jgi:hypothetical protein
MMILDVEHLRGGGPLFGIFPWIFLMMTVEYLLMKKQDHLSDQHSTL